MDKILEHIGKVIEGVTEPERVEKMLDLAVRLLETYAKIKAL